MSESSLLFAATAAFSIYGVSYYRKNGSSPEYSVQDADHPPIEDQGILADTSDKLNGHENMQISHSHEHETRVTHTNAEEQIHPSGPIPWNLQQPSTIHAELSSEPVDTSYHGGRNSYESMQQPQSQPTYQYSANNPRYDMHHSNMSQFVGGAPTQIGGRPSRQNLALTYDHGGYATTGTVDFPEGDYAR